MTIEPISDERLADIRANVNFAESYTREVVALMTADALALLSRLDKAEAGWRRDVGILLANIRQIEDATGEGPEGEDAQIVDQIEREYEALPPPPSES